VLTSDRASTAHDRLEIKKDNYPRPRKGPPAGFGAQREKALAGAGISLLSLKYYCSSRQRRRALRSTPVQVALVRRPSN